MGDDAICIKSGKDEEGRRRGIPTENVIVRNCRVFEGHGGFVVGSEMSGDVRNISVSDCEFMGTDVGIRLKSNRGRGGIVENIFIDHVNMTDISREALLFDLYYTANGGPGHNRAVADETTPVFRKITISDVTSYGSDTPVKVNGLPEMPVEDFTLTNSVFISRHGGLVSDARNIVFRNVDIEASEGNAITINNACDFVIEGCTFVSPDGESIAHTGRNENVRVM